jgi:phosphate acyltransferase
LSDFDLGSGRPRAGSRREQTSHDESNSHDKSDRHTRARESVVVVAVDCNGADLGPQEVAAGALLAAGFGASTILFGPAAELEPVVAAAISGGGATSGAAKAIRGSIEIVDAPVSIAKTKDPASAARNRPDASIVQAARAVADGRAQALVCAGGTGAAVAAGLFNVKRARGIHRPALALPLPVPGRPVTLLDVGAGARARSEHLEQFAFMGAALVKVVLGVERPRVGLLSNGEEAERGSPSIVEAHERLRARVSGAGAADGAARAAAADGVATGSSAGPMFELVGNVEGGDLVSGVADVIVTDGLTGNVALKVMEGVSQTLLGAIREAAMGSAKSRLGGLLLKPALAGLREEIDPEAQGGAYLLGLRGLAVVPHGSFQRRGFCKAILRAKLGADQDLVGTTHAALAAAGALRQAPMSASVASLPRG